MNKKQGDKVIKITFMTLVWKQVIFFYNIDQLSFEYLKYLKLIKCYVRISQYSIDDNMHFFLSYCLIRSHQMFVGNK